MSQLAEIWGHFRKEYEKKTPKRIQIIDYFLIFTVVIAGLQFLYVMLAGQFPFNSFLAGFICSVGLFVFTVCLRLQVTNPSDFHNISQERAYADFVVCNLLLYFVVVTFMG